MSPYGLVLSAMFLLGAAPPEPLPDTPPAPAAKLDIQGALVSSGPALEVELVEAKRLRLIKWVYGRSASEVGLDGKLVIKLHNRGEDTVHVRRFEHHGLVFRDLKTKEEHLIVHSCACMRDSSDPPPPLRVTREGREFSLDDFGCGGGMWKAPPPGRYALSYRALIVPEPTRPSVEVAQPTESAEPGEDAKRPSPHEVIEACRQELGSEAFWQGAVESKPVEIRLRKPRRKRVR